MNRRAFVTGLGAVLGSPLRRLGDLLGRYDTDSEMFDLYADEPPNVASPADDLADVYLDLAKPLRLFESGRVAEPACDWAFGIRALRGSSRGRAPRDSSGVELAHVVRLLGRRRCGQIPSCFRRRSAC